MARPQTCPRRAPPLEAALVPSFGLGWDSEDPWGQAGSSHSVGMALRAPPSQLVHVF